MVCARAARRIQGCRFVGGGSEGATRVLTVANKSDLANLNLMIALSLRSIMFTPVSRSGTKPLQYRDSHERLGVTRVVLQLECVVCQVQEMRGSCLSQGNFRIRLKETHRQSNKEKAENFHRSIPDPLVSLTSAPANIPSVSASVKSRRPHCLFSSVTKTKARPSVIMTALAKRRLYTKDFLLLLHHLAAGMRTNNPHR